MLQLLGKEDVTKAFLVRQLLKGWSKAGFPLFFCFSLFWGFAGQ